MWLKIAESAICIELVPVERRPTYLEQEAFVLQRGKAKERKPNADSRSLNTLGTRRSPDLRPNTGPTRHNPFIPSTLP
jgi:hypothetical protein